MSIRWVLFAWVGFFQLQILATPLDEVRNKFPHFETETEIDLYLTQLEADASALASVYKGALFMFKSKFAVAPTAKYKFFKKGKNFINAACLSQPNALEIRFVRLIFQYQLPSFLGYNDHKESDFKFIMTHFAQSNLSAEKKKKMIDQMLQLEKLESDKIKQIKNL